MSDLMDVLKAEGWDKVDAKGKDFIGICPPGVGFCTFRRGRVRAELAFSCDLHEGKHGVTFYMHPRAWVIAALVTDTGARGKGEASAALKSIINVARQYRVSTPEWAPEKLYLEPQPMSRKYGSGLKKTALVGWYARAGFKSENQNDTVMSMELT
jgi:hypothetical protein